MISDGEILKEFIDNQKKPKKLIAKELGMSRTNLYQFFTSSEIEQANKMMFEDYFGMPIFTQVVNEDSPTYTKERMALKSTPKTKKIPFYDAEASGGDVTLTEMSVIDAPSGTIDVGDLLSDSQAAIRIYGNSMLPNYPPGCVVGLNKVTKSFIQPGEVYVIETREQRLLKRLFYKDDEDESKIMCVSDNLMKFEGGARHGKLAYPSFTLPKEEIINLFVVTGVIKRNTNSIIINR
jgi:hypothetical protein